MTDKEKAIVMAHTGICMLTGDKFQIFHKYVEDIMNRPIMTHELGWLEDEIKEKSKADFMALCANESNSEKPNKSKNPTGSIEIKVGDDEHKIPVKAELILHGDRVVTDNIKWVEQEPNTWSLDDAREDFMYDVYNTLDFLPTNEEANRIIDSFDRVTSSIKQEPILDKIKAEITDWQTDIHDNEHDAESYDFVFERIYEIIDEYKAESEE